MRRTEKTNSTKTRLLSLQESRARGALFFSGLFALMLIAAGFCYVNDSLYTRIYNPFILWGAVTRDLQFTPTRTLWLPTVRYVVETEGRFPRLIDATVYFYTAIAGSVILSLLNGIFLKISRPVARLQIDKQLTPLYNMAQTALRLTDDKGAFPPDKAPGGESYDGIQIHNLESAIDSLKPDVLDAQLHTGDKDLQGLEDAINSLINRTRESYSQQIRFVSDASHELRTPIAVIKGYTDMLDRWGKKDETILEESIAAIKTETDHMNRLVEQLLFLARGDSGRTKLSFATFSLSDMVREVYEESIMIDSRHQWAISAESEVTAYGDIGMLKQATRILVDNAAKYTPEGEKISLKAVYDTSGVPAIIVQDNGIGISGEDMSHIFDRFYRSDPARGRQQGGTGLGLAIAKWIVDRHGGYFDVLSREEFGTRISIHLPMKKGPEALQEKHALA